MPLPPLALRYPCCPTHPRRPNLPKRAKGHGPMLNHGAGQLTKPNLTPVLSALDADPLWMLTRYGCASLEPYCSIGLAGEIAEAKAAGMAVCKQRLRRHSA